jgi:preprotein translocase subunit YajC
MDLPRWKCHKEVEGFQIDRIVGNSLISADANVFVTVSEDYMEKHKPFVGGYFVRYLDGYESFSPAEAFENGYSKKRRVLHIRLPEHMSPSIEDMQAVMDMFMAATEDPVGSVVVTGHGITGDIVEVQEGETYSLVCVTVGEDELAKFIKAESSTKKRKKK